MNNKEFLNWIYERLKVIHKENEDMDYMIRLKQLVKDMEDEE